MHLLAEEQSDRVEHALLPLLSEHGRDGKSEHLPARRLRLRQIAGLISQEGKCGLQVKWIRIVDFGRNAALRQKFPEIVATGSANHKLVVHMFAVGRYGRQLD